MVRRREKDAQRRSNSAVGIHHVQTRRFIEKRFSLFRARRIITQNLNIKSAFRQILIDHFFEIKSAVEIMRMRVCQRRDDELGFKINGFINFRRFFICQNPVDCVKSAFFEAFAIILIAVGKLINGRLSKSQ